MWDGLLLEVLNKYFHGRVVRKAAFLLIESEVRRMQMYDERRLAAAELAKDMRRIPDQRFR